MKTYNDMPLCTAPLNRDEAYQLDDAMMPLLRFLGSPGDWGYSTKLGCLAQMLHRLRKEILDAAGNAIESQTKEDEQ